MLTFCGHPGEKQRDQNDNPSGSFSPQIHGEAAEGAPVSAGGARREDNVSSPAPRKVCPTPAGAKQRGGRMRRGEAGGGRSASNFWEPSNFPPSFASSATSNELKRQYLRNIKWNVHTFLRLFMLKSLLAFFYDGCLNAYNKCKICG